MKDSVRKFLASLIVLILNIAITQLGLAAQDLDANTSSLTIAIMEFEDVSTNSNSKGLSRALQSMLTTDLLVSREIALVERGRLSDVLKELELVKSGFLDKENAATLGKGVGAKAVLTGSLMVSDEQIRIDARLVHVETGTVLFAEKIEGLAPEFIELEKKLSKQVLKAIGIKLSAFQVADLSKVASKNVEAVNKYGLALNAYDSGDLSRANRLVASAKINDPKFALADALRAKINFLLEQEQEADFRHNVRWIAQFEDRLNGGSFPRSNFTLDKYPKLLKEHGQNRALFYWVTRVGPDTYSKHAFSPYDLLFSSPNSLDRNSGTVTQAYLNLGAAEPILFWTDVATSDPRYAPSVPLTNEMLNPDPLKRPIWGPWPAYNFHKLVDVYRKLYLVQAWCMGEFDQALETLKELKYICAELVNESGYRHELSQINKAVSSHKLLFKTLKDVRTKQLLWSRARDYIVEQHGFYQQSRFYNENQAPKLTSHQEVRRQLNLEFAKKIFVVGGEAAQQREADRVSRRLLEIAGDTKFVARKSLVGFEGNRGIVLQMTHLAGCPFGQPTPFETKAGWAKPDSATRADSKFQKLDSPDDAAKKDYCPCEHCRPFRWCTEKAVKNFLRRQLVAEIERIRRDNDFGSTKKLFCLLKAFSDNPNKDLHDSLAIFCRFTCDSPVGMRTIHAESLQALSRIATKDDLPWLSKLLQESVWWDVRINAAATMASIGDKSCLPQLREALEKEEIYFVRHSLRAALARVHETQIVRRFEILEEEFVLNNLDKVRSELKSLLTSVQSNKELPAPTRTWWEAELYVALSRAESKLGNLETEIEYLRSACHVKPNDVAQLNNLGYVLASHDKNLDESERSIRRALQLSKDMKRRNGQELTDDAYLLDSLGYVLFKKGNHEEAKLLIEKCLEDPDTQTIEVYDHLGDICFAMKKNDEAVAAWRLGLKVARKTLDEKKLVDSVKSKIEKAK